MHQTIALRIDEDDTDIPAFTEAELRGDHFEAVGRARRNPRDRPLSVVGEEPATADATDDPACRTMEAAQVEIERFPSR